MFKVFLSKLMNKLEICLGDTDVLAIENIAYSNKQMQKRQYYYEQSAITLEATR